MSIRFALMICTLTMFAAELSAQSVLEEIMVTARKRAESLDDVPISVAVTSGEKLDRMAINGLEELSGFTPNLQINENATQQTVTIRGIGSGANQAFEQSVGTYIDGVYFGRGRSARNSFFDIERVEILKGPQGILFGKNTIAGAVNIITRKPTDEFEAYLVGEYFSDVEQWGITAVASGPFSETMRGRIAASYKSEDGYVNNTFTGNEEAEREDYALRGTIVWDVTDALTATFKAEVSSYDVKGRTIQLVAAGPLAAIYTANDPGFETNLDFTISTPGDDFDNTDTANFTLNLEYELNDNLSLTSLTSYVEYDFNNNIPGEFGPIVDYAEQRNQQDHEQISEELRLHYTSNDARFEFLGGVYYQREELNIVEDFSLNLSRLLDIGVPRLPRVDSSIFTFFEQDTESYAIFGEGSYAVIERLRLSVGLRYSHDEKKVNKRLIVAALGTQTPDPSQLQAASRIGRIPHAYALDRTYTDLSPFVGVQFDLTDNAMIYGTWSQGYKSGGFDAQNVSGTLSLAAFRPEAAKAWETGGKFTFLDGAAKFNIAYFDNAYKNLQVSAWNGVAFIVENAASATSRGVEADVKWRLTENFILAGAIAWLDAEYDSFIDAVCTAPQQISFNATTGRPPGQCSQNISGRDLQFSPQFAGNINAEYVQPVMDNYLLTIQGDVNFTSSYQTALDLDPVAKQQGFAKLNARLELAGSDNKWALALVGKNLTGKKTTTWVNDVPFFRGAYFGFIDSPRSIGVQARISM